MHEPAMIKVKIFFSMWKLFGLFYVFFPRKVSSLPVMKSPNNHRDRRDFAFRVQSFFKSYLLRSPNGLKIKRFIYPPRKLSGWSNHRLLFNIIYIKDILFIINRLNATKLLIIFCLQRAVILSLLKNIQTYF